MCYLADHYAPVSVQNLLDFYDHDISLPRRAVMVTFDDASRDFAEYAWPIMQRHRIPVTLFVPTAYPDHPERFFWWDHLYHAIKETKTPSLQTDIGVIRLTTPNQRRRAFKVLREDVKDLPHEQAMVWLDETFRRLDAPPPIHNVLSWEELRRLYREGVTMGAHTRTHPMVQRIKVEEACEEAVGALSDLKRELGEVPPIFAYPSGGFSDEVVQMLASEGFLLAFTTINGLNDLKTADRLRLNRFNIGRLSSTAAVRARLLPYTLISN
jgi:peptidoglycan/xylan/chitin deacetylase (PgdA/CDA1 family)